MRPQKPAARSRSRSHTNHSRVFRSNIAIVSAHMHTHCKPTTRTTHRSTGGSVVRDYHLALSAPSQRTPAMRGASLLHQRPHAVGRAPQQRACRLPARIAASRRLLQVCVRCFGSRALPWIARNAESLWHRALHRSSPTPVPVSCPHTPSSAMRSSKPLSSCPCASASATRCVL